MNKKQYLYKSLLELKSSQEVKEYLDDLLTPNEIREFSERLWIASMLVQGNKYEQISEDTKSSSRTIARVKKCLDKDQSGYRLILERLHHRKHQKSL